MIIVEDPDHITPPLNVNSGFARHLKMKMRIAMDTTIANDPPIIFVVKNELTGSNSNWKNSKAIISIKGRSMWIVSFNLLNMLVKNMTPKA